VYKASIPSVSYQAPWDISFDDRMALLTRGSPRVAYFYSVPDTSTFRYRAYNVAQSLSVATFSSYAATLCTMIRSRASPRKREREAGAFFSTSMIWSSIPPIRIS
jgi:hypothetical protein